MDKLSSFEKTVWILQTAIMAVLMARLLWLRLAGRYRWLILFLATSGAGSVALMMLPFDTNRYAYTWAGLEVLKWLLAALVLHEIAGLVLAGYKGLSIISSRSLLITVVLCALGALTIVSFGFNYRVETFPLLRTVLLFQQAMALTLLLCLLILLVFVLWFPLPLPRNVHLYCFGFLVPLLATTLTVGGRILGGEPWHRTMSLTSLVIYVVSFSAWAWRIRNGGETGPQVAAIPRGPETERRLLSQLAALNQALESRRRNL